MTNLLLVCLLFSYNLSHLITLKIIKLLIGNLKTFPKYLYIFFISNLVSDSPGLKFLYKKKCVLNTFLENLIPIPFFGQKIMAISHNHLKSAKISKIE